jgi:hypothetical protein
VTIDYSRFRGLARALGGGRPSADAALAAISVAPAPLPDIDAAPPRPPQMLFSPPAPSAPYIDPVDKLLAALDAATDDAQCGALLAAASITLREGLAGALAHRAMVSPQPDVALDALMTGLDSAVDDTERAALLSAATRELRAALADRLWWRNISADVAQERYLDMCR